MVSDALQLRAVGWAAAVAALGAWALLERRGAPTGVALAAQVRLLRARGAARHGRAKGALWRPPSAPGAPLPRRAQAGASNA